MNLALGEQNRKREEAMHAMDMIHREKEHTAETEKLKLQSKITEDMDEMNKRVLTKEIKLREEIQDKHQQLEKVRTGRFKQIHCIHFSRGDGLAQGLERWTGDPKGQGFEYPIRSTRKCLSFSKSKRLC